MENGAIAVRNRISTRLIERITFRITVSSVLIRYESAGRITLAVCCSIIIGWLIFIYSCRSSTPGHGMCADSCPQDARSVIFAHARLRTMRDSNWPKSIGNYCQDAEHNLLARESTEISEYLLISTQSLSDCRKNAGRDQVEYSYKKWACSSVIAFSSCSGNETDGRVEGTLGDLSDPKKAAGFAQVVFDLLRNVD